MEAAHPALAEVPLVKRTRRKTGKSRQGCARCKARRIKCDENRPGCGNCSRIERPCPGFQHELRWSGKHERFKTTASPGQTKGHHVPDTTGRRGEAEHTNTKDQGPRFTNLANTLYDEDESLALRIGTCQAAAAEIQSRSSNAAEWDVGNAARREHHGTSGPGIDTSGLSDASCGGHELTAVEIDLYYPMSSRRQRNLEIDDTWDAENSRTNPSTSQFRGYRPPMSDTRIVSNPLHLPTTLIEHWFRYICPMWSTFDSDTNFNRLVASSTWTTSKAVFYAMQAMSAACLTDSMPGLNKTLPSLRIQATAAIDQGISQVRHSKSPKVTPNLLFAVFALGTSLHWSDPTQSVHPWLESVRELLMIWQAEPSTRDTLMHAYFCQALTYWELLSTAAGRGPVLATVERRRQEYQTKLRQALELPGVNSNSVPYGPSTIDDGRKLLGARPNSWCGISIEVIDLFGQVLALCRNSRRLDKSKTSLTLDLTSNALCDIAFAHELQRELLAMDFGTLILKDEEKGFTVQTQDEKTPVSHLLQTAEAYRQAALLQLHLAFSDLAFTPEEKRRIFMDTVASGTTDDAVAGGRFRGSSLLELALRLVNILENIPSDSGSRAIHSILYLSAAAGLRFDACQRSQDDFDISSAPEPANSLLEPPSWTTNPVPQGSLLHSSHPMTVLNECIPRSTLEVSTARRLVWARLGSLRRMLPRRTINSTLQLVKSMWQKYDSSDSDAPSAHWFDIMASTGLEITL